MGRKTRAAAEARRTSVARWRVSRARLVAARSGAGFGALVGLVLAGFALLVGIGRMLFVILIGRQVQGPTSADFLSLGVYVIMFVIGGAFVGAVHEGWTSRVATSGAFVIAGASLMNVLAFFEAPQQYDHATMLWMSGIGAAFGLAGAYGASRKA